MLVKFDVPSVLWNMAQTITDPQKLQARKNIGAAGLSSLAASFESRAPSYNWSANEVCTYGGALWQFDSDHSGAWTGADAHETNIMEVLMSAEKKKFVVLGTISGTCEYEFTGNARNASFSPSDNINGNLATMAISTADKALAGFKAGTKTKIKGFMVRSVMAEGLATATAGAASLDFQLSAVDDNGLTVETYNYVYQIVNVQWNRMEYKDIELAIPDTLPSGATGFMLTLLSTSRFYVDDYNVQNAYIGQKVKPEIVMEVECDKMVDVLNGTDIV